MAIIAYIYINLNVNKLNKKASEWESRGLKRISIYESYFTSIIFLVCVKSGVLNV